MYFFDSKTHTNMVYPEYIDKIVEHRYKDTPFAIIQEGKSGAKWTIYIIFEMKGETYVSGYGNYYTKRSAIKEIEEGRIIKSINKEFDNLKILYDVLNKHKI